GRLRLGCVLLADWGVRVGLGDVGPPGGLVKDRRREDRAANEGGIGTGLLGCRAATSRGGALQTRLEVGVTKHSTAMLGEVLHQLHDLLSVLDSVPEHDTTVPGDAAIGLVKEPSEVLIILPHSPDKLRVLLAEG